MVSPVRVWPSLSSTYHAGEATSSGQKGKHQSQAQGQDQGHGQDHGHGQEQREGQGKVVVLAATNRLEDLDEAVLRRFETKVYVGLPDLPARLDMLHRHLRGIDCQLGQQDLLAVSNMTAAWSGSDIEVTLSRSFLIFYLFIFLFFWCNNKNFCPSDSVQRSR